MLEVQKKQIVSVDHEKFQVMDQLGPFTFRIQDRDGLFYVLRIYRWADFIKSESYTLDNLLLPMANYGAKHQIVQVKKVGILPLKWKARAGLIPELNNKKIWEDCIMTSGRIGPVVITDAFHSDIATIYSNRSPRRRKLSRVEKLTVLLQVAYQVTALHMDGLTHNSIKPSRVLHCPIKGITLSTPDKEKFCLDDFQTEMSYTLYGRWSIEASMFAAPKMVGYGDPETVEDTEFTTREMKQFDIFSYGTLFYYMLTGCRYIPWGEEDWKEEAKPFYELIIGMRREEPNAFNQSLVPAIQRLEKELFS